MFGISGLYLARTRYYFRGVRLNVRLEKSCFSYILASQLSQCQTCHSGNHSFTGRVYKRWFKLCCCLSNEEESNRNGNKIMSEYMNSRVTVSPTARLSNSNYVNGVYGLSKISGNLYSINGTNVQQEILQPPPKRTGIEVFPEIFDQLPPKCTGCGAILQSGDENKPGFIPENRNPNLSRNLEQNCFLPETICMRCFSLKHYNKDVPPMVSPATISNFLTHISRRKALILYVVDIMDIPGSFAEDILKIVGETKHIILICNKVDRLPVDGHPRRQIQHIKKIIAHEAAKFGLKNANISDISVISAKTGSGLHDLVKLINKHWRKKSDMYIVGSNNSGKTTLFNLFVDLFTASRHSDNMLQRGTVSAFAGTTLSLLRYPVTKHRFLRLQDRLKSGYSEIKSKENLKEVKLSDEIIDKQQTKYRDTKETVQDATTAMSPYTLQFVMRQKTHDHKDLSWLYDTPGLYSKNQITHLLTNQELKLLNPTLWFVPRTVILRPGKVVFLGGLARLDYLNIKRRSKTNPDKEDNLLQASQSIFFTIFASPNLPIHVTSLEKADNFYEQHAGNELLKVPSGEKPRMAEFPEFKERLFEIKGVDWRRSAADVISNIGWIAVTAGSGSIVTLKAYTPNGAGLHLREPALLPTSVRQRGRRGVPYMGYVNHNMYQGTRRRSPALTKYFFEENLGTSQWMKVAEQKRKRQRALLKFDKTRYHSKFRLGFSAQSNPARYLPGYDVEVTTDGHLESEGKVMLQIEDGDTGRKE